MVSARRQHHMAFASDNDVVNMFRVLNIPARAFSNASTREDYILIIQKVRRN